MDEMTEMLQKVEQNWDHLDKGEILKILLTQVILLTTMFGTLKDVLMTVVTEGEKLDKQVKSLEIKLDAIPEE